MSAAPEPYSGNTEVTCPRCLLTFPVNATASSPAAPEAVVGGGTVTIDPEGPAPAVPATPADLPSHIGRFEVRRYLGEGAFGRVFEAYDPSLRRIVALKVAKPELMSGQRRVERFQREARAAANLMHPNIVAVFDSGRDGPHHYIASAFVSGRSLAAVLTELPDGQTLDLRQAVQMVRKLAEALAYAHKQGVVHRDVKPANVMLREDGEPLLMDFGLAARADETEKLTVAGQFMGTPEFTAPEQWRGQASAGSDQYSLGCLLFELLTGRVPFRGSSPEHYLLLHTQLAPPSPRSLRPGVPRDLETICLTCLEKDPARRYANCQALADDLRRWLEGEPVTARPPSRVERAVKWARRQPAAAVLGVSVLAALGLAVLSGVAIWQWRAADDALAREREARQQKDSERAQRALVQVETLLMGDPHAAAAILDNLTEQRDDVVPRLRQVWAEPATAGNRQRRMRAALILLPVEPVLVQGDLVNWMLDLTGPAELLLVCKALELCDAALRDSVQSLLIRELDRRSEPAAREPEREALAQHQANAALVLARLVEPKRAWSVLKHSPYPEARSRLIHRLGPGRVPAETLARRLETEKDVSIRRALIVALGEYRDEQVSAQLRRRLLPTLLRWYRDDADPGIHGAIDWLLRHAREGPAARVLDWGQAKALRKIDSELAGRPQQGRGWYVNGQGQTLTVVNSREPFLMGSPSEERARFRHEKQHWRLIGRHYAIATKTVTVAQFQRFRKDHSFNQQYSPEADCPVNAVTWYEAAAYCNWLSEQEGIPKEQRCYPDKIDEGMKPYPDYLKRKGYRLATEAEWEFACRAGTVTSRSYGSSLELLPRYAWYAKDRSWPVG
jgi:hypothetical protein